MLAHHTGDGASFVPGADLEATRLVVQPADIDEEPILQDRVAKDPDFLDGHFWPDGRVRVSGREFNMLVQSPCYKDEAFSCLSCHALHQPDDDPRPVAEWANDQLGPGMDGDGACLPCHPGLDATAHTHHELPSTGSRCYECHMPYSTYGLQKAIRSHQVDSPTVTESVEYGRPNACNQCHLDRSLGWTASYLQEWYGMPSPELTVEQHEVAASVIWSLSGDAGLRALMAWSMGWEAAREASGEEWLAPYLITLLDDPYAAVRYIAQRSLKRLPGFHDLDYDYLGSRLDRQQSIRQADRVRERRAGDVRPDRPATLVGAGGAIDDATFQRLYASRDDRVIRLRE